MDIAISHLLTAVDHVDTAALTTALAQTALGLVGVRTGIGADYIAGFAQMERNKDGQVTLEQIQDAIDAVHDVVEARDGCSSNFKAFDGKCVACSNDLVHDAGTDPSAGNTYCVQPVPNVDSSGDAQVTAFDVLCVATACSKLNINDIETSGCLDALAQMEAAGADTSDYTCSMVCRDSDSCSGEGGGRRTTREETGDAVVVAATNKASNLRYLIASYVGDNVAALTMTATINNVKRTSEFGVTRSVRFELDGGNNPVLVTPEGLAMMFDEGVVHRSGHDNGHAWTNDHDHDHDYDHDHDHDHDHGKGGSAKKVDTSGATEPSSSSNTYDSNKKGKGKKKNGKHANLSAKQKSSSYSLHRTATIISSMAAVVAFVLGVLFILRKRTTGLEFQRKMRSGMSKKEYLLSLSASVANLIEENGGKEEKVKAKVKAKKETDTDTETTALLSSASGDASKDAEEYTLPSDIDEDSPARSARGRQLAI